MHSNGRKGIVECISKGRDYLLYRTILLIYKPNILLLELFIGGFNQIIRIVLKLIIYPNKGLITLKSSVSVSFTNIYITATNENMLLKVGAESKL